MKLRILLPLLCLLFIRCATSGFEEEIPLPPTELRATVVSTNQVDLSWKDNSTNETAYKIERKTDSGNFSEIGSTSKDVTTFSDQTVSLNTTYTYRVYSTNTAGKSILYSNEAAVKTISVPTLTTTSLTEVTAIGAKSGGNISSDGGSPITARGVVWSTEPAPTIAVATKTSEGTGTGAFPSTLTGLTGNTKYYVRAYATNAAGTSYGDELYFTTSAAVLPSIITVTVTEITSNGAKTGGSITALGNAPNMPNGNPYSARGVVWGTSTGPTIALATKTNDMVTPCIFNAPSQPALCSFQSNITGLAANTKYYVRAYVTTSVGTGYGNEFSFTTTVGATVPSITTVSVTEITASGAKTGGSTTADGNSPITARGVVWGTATGPTMALATKTSNGSGSGAFVSSITGLAANTKYYVRAYATNGAGTGYGNEFSFTTTADATIPSITTVSVTEVTTSGAKTGGSITADGNSPITARGVVWGTATAPTIALATKTSNGSGSGAFVSSITGLAANTKYYVRAYATNSAGTGYGNEFSFTTTAGATAPSITTVSVTDITATTAKAGGNIISDGGSAITARGVVWSNLISSPTIALVTKTSNGSGSAAFVSIVTGLAQNTTYYLRAYATNNLGTSYGQTLSFRTGFAVRPFVTTVPITQVTGNSALVGGKITSDGGDPIIRSGVTFNTTGNPLVEQGSNTTIDVSPNGTGEFQTVLTGLWGNQKYYVKAFAINSVGISYGDEFSFTTEKSTPVVGFTGSTNYPAIPITPPGIPGDGNKWFEGEIRTDGGYPIIQKGFVWDTSLNPTIELTSKTTSGSGSLKFSSTITFPKFGTTYYIRAYATNQLGTSYSSNYTRLTSQYAVPTVTTATVTDITANSAKSGGTALDDSSPGGYLVDKGILVYDNITSANNLGAPIIEIKNGPTGGWNPYVSQVTNLVSKKTYYIRAFVKNREFTGYGKVVTFRTN
ncbi:MAG: hypothetical protein NBV57_01010 [Algoriphagus sp.]|nr:hypothetical protein [Algoriphagus sp.]